MTLATSPVVEQKRSTTPLKFSWLETIQGDLEKLTQKIRSASFLEDQLLDAAVQMIIEGGGKRMRPAVTFLVGRATNASFENILSVAASVELLHTATLVHDDLVDNANERRGVPTLHQQIPLGITVLTGDFLFAQAAALAAEADNVRVVKVFADTLVSIVQGEILQAKTRWQVPSMDIYERRIYGKTAALFEAAALSGSILGDVEEDVIQASAAFGREIGLAFQIVDDALDFVSSTEKLGKPAGNDLRQGIITLPALKYMEAQEITPKEFIETIKQPELLEHVINEIRETGAARLAFDDARLYIQRAEKILYTAFQTPTPAVEHLVNLAYSAIDRDF
jgi:geranylgeranyl pyrophosphate synthase